MTDTDTKVPTPAELVDDDAPLDLEDLVDELTLGDLEELETILDAPIGKALGQLNTQNLSAATITSIVWLSLRKRNPDVTVEQAQGVKLRRLTTDEEGDTSPR
jgi:hypothetical protein